MGKMSSEGKANISRGRKNSFKNRKISETKHYNRLKHKSEQERFQLALAELKETSTSVNRVARRYGLTPKSVVNKQ